MSDPGSEKQLIAGFWGLEEGKWRWTAQRFAVVLLPPPGSQQNGATLRVQFFVPSYEIEKLGPLTLNASVGEIPLDAETVTNGGASTYTRKIPASLMGSNMIPIVFTLDKAMPKAETDGRDLGIVVSELALETNDTSPVR